MAPEIDHLQRALKAKSADIADTTLQRHLALFRESQLKVELEKLRRKGRFEDAEEKADELEKQISLLGSYDFTLKALANEAIELYRQITELEAEELKLQLQELRSKVRQTKEGPERAEVNIEALSRQLEEVTSAWVKKSTEVDQLKDNSSKLSRAWRDKFLGLQLK